LSCYETARAQSNYSNSGAVKNTDQSKNMLGDGYTAGDVDLFYREPRMKERKLLYGVPLEERGGRKIPPSGIDWCNFTDGDRGLLFVSSIFHDDGGLTFL